MKGNIYKNSYLHLIFYYFYDNINIIINIINLIKLDFNYLSPVLLMESNVPNKLTRAQPVGQIKSNTQIESEAFLSDSDTEILNDITQSHFEEGLNGIPDNFLGILFSLWSYISSFFN